MTFQPEDPKQHGLKNKRLLTGLVLAGILLFGLILRTSYLREIINDPAFSFPLIDPGYHDYWARALVSGDWTIPDHITNDPEIRTSPYIRPPGYPFFLAFVYYLSGSSYLAARIVQMGLGLISCLLAYFLGKNLFGRGPGLVFAAFMSVYWVFIFFEGELLAPVLLVPLALSLMHSLRLWYDKITFWRAFAGGVFLALFALVRPTILLFGPLVLGWAWWVARRRENAGRIVMTWLAFVLGAAMVIAPATIRNYLVAQDFVIITSNAGLNLYIANNKDSDGIAPRIPILKEAADMDNWTNFDYTEIIRRVGLLHGRTMKHSEVSSYFAKEAVHYILKHPARILGLVARKAALFWGPIPVACNKELYYEKLNSSTLRHIPGFPVAVSFAIVGLLQLSLGWKRLPRQNGTRTIVTQRQFELSVLILLFIITYFISHLPFVAAGRYRVPVIPFLFLFGGYGLYRIAQLAISGKKYSAAWWSVVCIVLYIAVSRPIGSYQPDQSRWHFSRACAYRGAKQFAKTIDECRKAIRLKPGFVKAHIELANALISLGRIDEAIDHYSQVLRIRPHNAQAHSNMGVALAAKGKLDEAIGHYSEALRIKPNYPKAHSELGNALAAKGKLDEAIHHYSEALRINPSFLEAHNNLGVALAAKGKLDEAVYHYSQVLRIRPDSVEAHSNLGNVYVKKGKLLEAINHYSRALRIKPTSFEAHSNLGFALAEQGRVAEAISHYSEALRINPDYAEAHNGLGRILFREGKIKEAISHFREELRIRPESADAHSLLRMALAAQERIDQAIAKAQEALRLNPANHTLHLKLGNLFKKNGQLDRAIDQYKTALSIKPTDYRCLNNLAMAYSMKMEYDKAISVFRKMIALRPDRPEPYYNIACVYAKQHRTEESIDWLNKAVKMGYDNWDLIKADKDLENIRGSSYYKKMIMGEAISQ